MLARGRLSEQLRPLRCGNRGNSFSRGILPHQNFWTPSQIDEVTEMSRKWLISTSLRRGIIHQKTASSCHSQVLPPGYLAISWEQPTPAITPKRWVRCALALPKLRGPRLPRLRREKGQLQKAMGPRDDQLRRFFFEGGTPRTPGFGQGGRCVRMPFLGCSINQPTI